ncbi:hypothetical protein K503DRAFT_78262, partial [Rhizopogon vinicolor AM-OR11-026]
ANASGLVSGWSTDLQLYSYTCLYPYYYIVIVHCCNMVTCIHCEKTNCVSSLGDGHEDRSP